MGKDEPVCCVCHLPEDKSLDARGMFTRELRPYGPGRKPICFQCAMGPERAEETKRTFRARLDEAGPVAVLDGGPPRPATPDERRRLVRRVK